MQFRPRLPYEKKIALDALNYFGSVKIFLKFSRPFWSELNKIPIIHYNLTSRKNGGTGISDDILRIVHTVTSKLANNAALTFQTYYPSNPRHGPSLLASYTWEHEADYWLSMTDDQCIQKVDTESAKSRPQLIVSILVFRCAGGAAWESCEGYFRDRNCQEVVSG